MTYLIVLFNLCWQYVLLLNIPKGEKQYLLKCIMQDLFTNSINTMRKHDTRVLYWIIKYETHLICQIYIQLQHILVTTVSSTYSQACSSTTNLSISSPWPSSAVTWTLVDSRSEFPTKLGPHFGGLCWRTGYILSHKLFTAQKITFWHLQQYK